MKYPFYIRWLHPSCLQPVRKYTRCINDKTGRYYSLNGIAERNMKLV